MLNKITQRRVNVGWSHSSVIYKQSKGMDSTWWSYTLALYKNEGCQAFVGANFEVGKGEIA